MKIAFSQTNLNRLPATGDSSTYAPRTEEIVSVAAFDASNIVRANANPATPSVNRSSSVDENAINAARMATFRANSQDKLINLIRITRWEFGESSPVEEFVEELLRTNQMATITLLHEMFRDGVARKDVELLVGILITISRLPEWIAGAGGSLLAANALLYPHKEVKEAGIRVFESWASTENIEFLETLDIKEKWLANYRSEVVRYLRNRNGAPC